MKFILRWLLVVYRYAHSSEHLPTLIKETSPCSLWQLKQRPSTVMQRIRVCKVLNPRWHILTPTLPLRLRNLHARRSIKTVRGRGHIVCVERKQTVDRKQASGCCTSRSTHWLTSSTKALLPKDAITSQSNTASWDQSPNTCVVAWMRCPFRSLVFEYVVLSWLDCLGRLRRRGLGGSTSLEGGL